MGIKRRTLEDLILYVIIAVVTLFLCWVVSGCSTTQTNRGASVKYKSTQNCEWQVRGGESITAKELEQEFDVGADCKLTRKTHLDSGQEENR
jgi:hypothetical protein